MSDKCEHSNHSEHKHGHQEGGHGHGHGHEHEKGEGHQHSWKADNYHKIITDMKYNGPKLIVEEFVKFGIAKDAKLLDVAAGTGLVGLELKANGYTNIDAIDGSEDMLVAAREGNCYKNVMAHMITGDSKIPIPDHTYDHLVMSGALCHIPFENIPQIIRLCKPGGIICWAIAKSEDLVSHVPAFKDGQFEKVIERLCSEKLWEFLPGFPKKAINFTHERDGWTYAMKVL